MSKCCFCKQEYKGYVVLIDDHIECFCMEQHIKDIYYNNEKGIGVCEPCRTKEFYHNPVWKIQAWLSVRCTLMLAESNKKIDIKIRKKYTEALERIKGYEKKLEATPEVHDLYMKNNPAMFKELLKEKTPCVYCGENDGAKWINDPNQEEPTIDACWWICAPCEKIIEKQEESAFLSVVNDRFEEKGIKVSEKSKERIKQLDKEIQDIAYEDGNEVACFEIKKEESGFKSKRKY